MSNVISPNMDLIIPTVGQEAGPQYAIDINESLSLIDSHDHSPGHGVQVTPTGLNINADLPVNQNNLTLVQSVQFGTLASQPDYTGALYESLGDLWYNDEVGNKIRITSGGSVVNSGGISGLVPPASVTYTAGKFVFQSNVNVAATLDAGTVIVREMVSNGKGISLVAPTGLAANYSLTMPGALPGSNGSLTLTSTSGVQSVLVPGTSGLPLVSSGTNVSYAQLSTTGIANNAVGTAQIANAAVIPAKMGAANWIAPTTSSVSTTSTSPVAIPGTAQSLTVSGLRPLLVTFNPLATGVTGNVTLSNPGLNATSGVLRIDVGAGSYLFGFNSQAGSANTASWPLSLSLIVSVAPGVVSTQAYIYTVATVGTTTIAVSGGTFSLTEL